MTSQIYVIRIHINAILRGADWESCADDFISKFGYYTYDLYVGGNEDVLQFLYMISGN